MPESLTITQKLAERTFAWFKKSTEQRRALCETIGPLELNGTTYAPNIESCIETGYKTWHSPAPEQSEG